MSISNSTVVASEATNVSEERSLPQVALPGKEVTISETAESLAAAYRKERNPEARVYRRGEAVCCIDRDSDGSFISVVLQPKRACSEFERVAELGKKKKIKDGNENDGFERDICSTDIASKILSSRRFLDSIPKINLITNVPVILDGRNNTCRIITSYDEASGIFPKGNKVADVSLEDALVRLHEVIADFHYQTGGDRSRAIAAMLSPALVAGGVLKANCPIMMLEADKSQSGKGYFTKLLGAIYKEIPVTVAQRSGGVGSFDESFDAAVSRGHQFIVMDNIRGKLNSPQIESFMTSPKHTVRVPYSGPLEIDPKRYFIMATSNNFELTNDLANRSNIIRIFKREEGYHYHSYEEGDILRHIEAQQPEYLGAVFAIIKEWVRLGKPVMLTTKHDFRDWCGALDWIVQNICKEAPLMEGHKEAQAVAVYPEVNWVKNIYSVTRDLGDLEKQLTAYEIAERCEVGDVELPGARGAMSLGELGETGKQQVCSQIGRRFSNLFKKIGEDNTIHLGTFSLKRECLKQTYASGKSEWATVYSFSSAV